MFYQSDGAGADPSRPFFLGAGVWAKINSKLSPGPTGVDVNLFGLELRPNMIIWL